MSATVPGPTSSGSNLHCQCPVRMGMSSVVQSNSDSFLSASQVLDGTCHIRTLNVTPLLLTVILKWLSISWLTSGTSKV